MGHSRVIRKYPNRRLYDAFESRYIALHDIQNLIASDVEITVVDRRTGNDITEIVLLQVLMESQQAGQHALSCEFMVERIRQLAKSGASNENNVSAVSAESNGAHA